MRAPRATAGRARGECLRALHVGLLVGGSRGRRRRRRRRRGARGRRGGGMQSGARVPVVLHGWAAGAAPSGMYEAPAVQYTST